MSNSKKHISVSAAILFNNNEILCMQRGPAKFDYISYKFEFPGGKIESNESSEEALTRELKEELHIDYEVKKGQKFFTVHHEYPDFKITMHSYLCHLDSREFTLTEHVDFKWLPTSELSTLDWAEADLPIIEKLIN